MNIPSTAFLYKEGLYIDEQTVTAGDLTWVMWHLYASEGYCFYDLQIPENYDDKGNLKPENERVYYTYSIMRKDEKYVTENIVSVPISEGAKKEDFYEITNEEYKEIIEKENEEMMP